MAHSYLISSFLAPGLNRRKDGWGGVAGEPGPAGPPGRPRRPRRGRRRRPRSPPRSALSDGFKGGVTTDEGIEFAQLLESDGTLDALQLSRRQLADEPDVPLPRRRPAQGVRGHDAAAGAVRHEDAGGQGLPQGRTPSRRRTSSTRRCAVPGRARDAADAARRHQPAATRWSARWTPASTSSPWAARCCASPTWSTSSQSGAPAGGVASTATGACRRSTPAPAARRSPR